MITPAEYVEMAAAALDNFRVREARDYIAEARQGLSWQRIRELLIRLGQGDTSYLVLVPHNLGLAV